MLIKEIVANIKYEGKETIEQVLDAFDNSFRCPIEFTHLNDCPQGRTCRLCYDMNLNEYMNKN